MENGVERLYRNRTSRRWMDRFRRLIEPPAPFIRNPKETLDAPLGRWNLYVGGAGSRVEGYVNVDVVSLPGVTVVADAHELPFRANVFTRIECDAVLEHVRCPQRVLRELHRVIEPGGLAHVVTPFCHPFHAYPTDFHRFTIDGLKQYVNSWEIVEEGWRTGPTATILVFTLEYVKLLLPWRTWRLLVHGILGWLLFPLRYLDVPLLKSPAAGKLGNHFYLWLRKR